MKKFYSLLVTVMTSVAAIAQTTIYSENMGTTATGNPVVTAFTGWQNPAPITYTGTADVRTTSVSSGYTGASGSDNVFFAAAGGRTFIIGGLNTSSATSANLQLNFGYTTSTTTAQMVVETSTDGSTWTPLTFTNNTNTSWALKTITGLPSSATLSLRFTAPVTASGMRVDDVVIINNNGSLAVSDVKNVKGNFIKNTFVQDDEIVFGSQVKDVKVYNMFGQVVKTSAKDSAILNVAELTRGNYIVTGTVNNQPVSQKILKD